MSELEFDISFSDVTIIEGEGKYDKVKAIMNEDFVGDSKWMLRSRCTLVTAAGLSEMVLHFYSDKKVYIMDYMPSIKDVFYNPDISSLNRWLQENGWGIPNPHKDLVDADKGLWRHFWETYLIDSEYLDLLYGERDNIYLDDEGDESGSSVDL